MAQEEYTRLFGKEESLYSLLENFSQMDIRSEPESTTPVSQNAQGMLIALTRGGGGGLNMRKIQLTFRFVYDLRARGSHRKYFDMAI